MVIGAAFLLFILIYIPSRIFSASTQPPSSSVLESFSSDKNILGLLDPALAFDSKTNTVWMAYTAEQMPQEQGSAPLFYVRMARSNGGSCANWQPVEGGFEAKRDDLLAPDSQTVFRIGAWRMETPTVVHDPDDKGREWKLYAYKYFWPKERDQALQIAQHYGVIVYKYSSDPAQGWSTEQWMFSPAPDYPPPPYEQMVLLHLNQLDPSLRKVTAYSRPSAIYKDGVLFMTLSAFTEEATPDRVIMIASRDHGISWLYAGTLLQKTDLGKIGPYTKLAGATLIEQEGRIYLAAVLGNHSQAGQGTFIFGFDDLNKGVLQRDPKTGAPLILSHLPLQGAQSGPMGGGFAAYTDACPFGILSGEQGAGTADFQIFKTYKKPVSN